MDGITIEIRNKIKCAVKAKLQEIEAYVDEELPDYIMVMIANRRSKAQMKSELSLFLGNSTDNFTDWLHSVLERLEAVAMSNNTTDKLKEAVSNIPKFGDSAVLSAEARHQPSLLHPNSTSVDPSPVVIKKENTNEEQNAIAANSNIPEEALQASTVSDRTYLGQALEDMDDDCLNIGEEQVQCLDENALSDKRSLQTVDNFGYKKRHGNRLDDRASKRARRDENNRRGRNDGRLQSKIFSVVRPVLSQTKARSLRDERDDILKDDESEDATQKNNLNSVVRVTSRRKLPASLQPTKKLILKAVAEAQKSVIANPPKLVEAEVKPMPALYTRKYRERQLKTETNSSTTENVMQQLQDTNEMEVDEDTPRIPGLARPIRQAVTEEVLEPYEEESNLEASRAECESQIEPRFIVTLDGITSRLSRKFNELPVEEDDIEIAETSTEKKSVKSRLYRRRSTGTEVDVSKPLERCKFWPMCRQGDGCPFYHPKTPCKAFPSCSYGEACLFVHPQCKFDAACTRVNCQFSHSVRSKAPSLAVAHTPKVLTAPVTNAKTICKFYPSCNNVSCQYYHPPACKYGVNCTRMGCTFYHPSTFPAKNKLKWIQTTK